MFNKNKKTFGLGILMSIMSIGFVCFLEKYRYTSEPFNFDRAFIYLSILWFCSIQLIFDIKKLWQFIFKYRYLIVGAVFAIIVIRGYNGSSIGMYDSAVQPSYRHSPIIGVPRAIRSDEFLVEAPGSLSQALRPGFFNVINNAFAASEYPVTMMPNNANFSIAVLARPNYWGYFFLPLNQAFSFQWYLPYFMLLLSSFEFFRLVTKDKRLLALVGALLITLAPAILWWGHPFIIMYGFVAVLSFNQLLKSTKKWKKVLWSIVIGLSGSAYIMTMYPAWMLPYGYFFLVIVIWIIVLNRKNTNWTTYLYLLISIILMIAIVGTSLYLSRDVADLMTNTVYPGNRVSNGGTHSNWLYSYYLNPFFLVSPYPNASEYSQYFSLYPLPLIMGVYQIIRNFKNKKHDLLLNGLMIVALLLVLWCLIPMPLFSKLTFLTMSTPARAQLVVGLICIVILIKLMSDYSTERIKPIQLSLALVATLIIQYLAFKGFKSDEMMVAYMSFYKIVIALSAFGVLMFLTALNNSKVNVLVCMGLLSITLISSANIHPINVGVDVLTNKPVSKVIQDIVDEDPEAKWMGPGNRYFSSIALANGARIYSSTNYVPNTYLWGILDPAGEYDDIYNRYANVGVSIGFEKEVPVVLDSPDLITIHLVPQDLLDLDVEYLISDHGDMEQFSVGNVVITQIYSEDGTYIYKVSRL